MSQQFLGIPMKGTSLFLVIAFILEFSMIRALNAATIRLNSSTEACRLLAYDDSRPTFILRPGDRILGTLTIGYGHTGPDVHIGLVWTQAQADAAQMRDLAIAEEAVQSALDEGNITMNDNQFGGTTDFVFNCGVSEFSTSTVRKLIVAGNLAAVPAQFQRWIYSKGQKMPGLVTRRAKETLLYNSPVAVALPAATEPSVTRDAVATPRVWTAKPVIAACVAGVSTVCSYAPDVAHSLSDAANQLQPLVDYGHTLKIAFLSCSLGGIVIGGLSSFLKHKQDATT